MICLDTQTIIKNYESYVINRIRQLAKSNPTGFTLAFVLVRASSDKLQASSKLQATSLKLQATSLKPQAASFKLEATSYKLQDS